MPDLKKQKPHFRKCWEPPGVLEPREGAVQCCGTLVAACTIQRAVCVCVCVSLLSFLLPSCVTMGKLLNVSVPVSSFVVRVSSDNTCALLNGAPGR